MEFFINMKLQIGEYLRTSLLRSIHTAQLVHLNHQDMCSNSLNWMTSYWVDQKFTKMAGIIKSIKIFAIPNAYVQLKLSWNVCTFRIYLKCTLKGANT